jgi:hypothetical protein
MSNFTSTEMATLRRAAANKSGSAYSGWSIGQKLRHCLSHYLILRNSSGKVVGFGKEGYVLTPTQEGLYTWGEERQRQAAINS